MATQLSKSQLIEKIATSTEMSKRDVKNVMEMLVDVGHKELKKNGILPAFDLIPPRKLRQSNKKAPVKGAFSFGPLTPRPWQL